MLSLGAWGLNSAPQRRGIEGEDAPDELEQDQRAD